MAISDDMLNAIEVEALTLDDNVVGVQVSLFGVPVHYLSKSTGSGTTASESQIGPCEMWLHWGHESGRIKHRALDESRRALQG